MADPVALQGFVDKWLAREPEMAACEVFFPAPQRDLFRAWGALSAELADCMFEIADVSVARTKLAWWADDLAAGVTGRHPLTRALFDNGAALRTQPDQWRVMAAAAMRLVESDHAPASVDEALAELRPVATAISQLEAALFGVATDANAQAIHLQLERSLRGVLGAWPERARIPADMRDAVGAPDLNRYATALRAFASEAPRGSLMSVFRRLVRDYRIRRLQAYGDAARAIPLSAWRGVLLAWRAARLSLRSRVRPLGAD